MIRLSAILFTIFILAACDSPSDLPSPANSNGPGGSEERPITTIPKYGKWADSNFPLNLKVSRAFEDSEIDRIETMASNWEVASDSLIDFYQTPMQIIDNRNYSNLDDFYDSEMGIYKSYDWFNELSSFTLAITQYFGHIRSNAKLGEYVDIVHSDIIMNYRDYDFKDDGSLEDFDLGSVVLHEMGHFVGLPHENNWGVESVMHASLNLGSVLHTPFFADEVSLHQIYGENNSQNIFALNIEKNSKGPRDGEFVSIIHELRANGECIHYLNGEIVTRHQ